MLFRSQVTPPTPPVNTVQISAPASVTAYNVNMPGTQGAGALTNDGSGNLSWVPGGSGSPSINVDGVTVSSPNLDSTTPVADSGYTLGTWKTSGSNISVEVPTSVISGISISVRQTVSAGPVDADGLPTLFPSTSASLSLTTQNVSSTVPFIATAVNGPGVADSVYQSTSNVTWSSLSASHTNYLYINALAGTTGATILQPIYQFGGTPAVTSGQFTFNISQMTGYLGNGSTAVATPIVFVGEAVAGSSTITSTVAYAYNGLYISPLQGGSVIGSGSAVSLNHNLGMNQLCYSTRWTLVNITSNIGYTAGQEIELTPVGFGSGQVWATAGLMTRNTTQINTNNSWDPQLVQASLGVPASINTSDWDLRLYVRRNF